jgi:hypothetical protein
MKRYVLTITDVFLNHKRVNVCEHTVKMAPLGFCAFQPEISSIFLLKNLEKMKRYVLTITNVFLNQKRVNVCKYTIKVAPHGIS